MEGKSTKQLELRFSAPAKTKSSAPEVASLADRIEAARLAKKKHLFRSILGRAAHLLSQPTEHDSPDNAG